MWFDRFRPSTTPETTVRIPIPRSKRFRLEVPISFTMDAVTFEGQCLNVSNSGLLATFEKAPEIWNDGLLLLEAGDHYLSINARVARIQERNVGFAFLIETENDRAAVSILVESVSDYPLMDQDVSSI